MKNALKEIRRLLKLVKTLTAERDAAFERERQLSERLANIAALTSDM
jgi:hypothetical protein